MKKIFMIAVMALVTLTVSAQDKPFAVGINVNYGLNKNYKNLGFGAKFQYEFVENFRAEASGNYFLKKDNCTMWDASINFHYLIPIADNLKIYPLVGATLLGAKVDMGGAIGSAYDDAKAAFISAGGSAADFDAYWPTIKQQAEAAYKNGGGSTSETKFGFNAGAGIEYNLSENFKINFEAKYQYVKDFDRPVLSIGAAYCF